MVSLSLSSLRTLRYYILIINRYVCMVLHPQKYKSITTSHPCLHGGTAGANQMSHLGRATPLVISHWKIRHVNHGKICEKLWTRIVAVNLPEGRSSRNTRWRGVETSCPRSILKNSMTCSQVEAPNDVTGNNDLVLIRLKWRRPVRAARRTLRRPCWGLGPKLIF